MGSRQGHDVDDLTALGGCLVPTGPGASEEISHTFNNQILAVSQVGVVDPNDVLNKPVCVTLRDAEGLIRYLHGIAREFNHSGIVRGGTAGDEFENQAIIVVPAH